MTRPTFEHVVLFVIVFNAVIMGVAYLDHDHPEAYELIHHLILAFFIAELLIRLHRAHWSLRTFFKQFWNSFDFAVIALALLPILPVGVSLLRLARLARLLHLARHATSLRLAHVVPLFTKSNSAGQAH